MRIRDFLDRIGVNNFDEAYKMFKELKPNNTLIHPKDIFTEDEIKELKAQNLI